MKILLLILISSSIAFSQKNAVILIGGQSNPNGAIDSHGGNLQSKYTGNMPYVFSLNATNNGWATLNFSGSNNNQYPTADGHTSFNLSFCYDLLSYGYDSVYLCQYAVNSSFLGDTLADNWNTATISSYYDWAKVRYKAGVDLLTSTGIDIDTIIFIWWQGESDATSSVQSAAYEANLTSFLNGITSYVNNSKLTVWIVRISSGLGVQFVYKNVVRAAESNVCTTLGYRLIDIDSYTLSDTAHYLSLTYCAMGQYWAYWFIYNETIKYNKPVIF